LLVGTSSALGAARLETLGNSFVSSAILARINSNDTNPTGFVCAKDRAGSIVQSGDQLGGCVFRGYDGSNYLDAAFVRGEVDGTPGANDMPGRLVFSTTADGASSPTERMRIFSTGTVGLAKGLAVGNITDQGSRIFFDNAVLPSGAGTNAIKWNSANGLLTYDTSSRLIKQDIVDSPYGIDAVKLLKPRKYFRIDDQQDEIGFIADEVLEVLPEFVPMGAKSVITGNELDTEQIPLGVNYDRLTAVLTKALQEALAEIDILKAKVATLEGA
jgi:hypothetical protein